MCSQRGRPIVFVAGALACAVLAVAAFLARSETAAMLPIAAHVSVAAADDDALVRLESELALRPDGAQPARRAVVVVPAPVSAAISADASSLGTGTLVGTVHLTASSPTQERCLGVELRFAGVSASWLRRPQDAARARDRVVAVDASGSFRAEELAAGAWDVVCAVPGVATYERRVTIAANAITQHTIELTRDRSVRVRLVDPDGRPLLARVGGSASILGSQLGAFVCSQAPTIGLPPGARGGALAFRAQPLAARDETGWWDIRFSDAPSVFIGVRLGDPTLAYTEVAPDALEVEIVFAAAALTDSVGDIALRVLDDETGAPVPRAFVRPRFLPGNHTAQSPDNDGMVRFEGLMPGRYEIEIDDADHVPTTETVTVGARECARAEVRLARGITISGRVVDAHDQPVRTAVSAQRSGAREGERWGAATALDGTFVLSRMPRGRYVLMDGRFDLELGREPSRRSPDATPDVFSSVDARGGSVSDVVVRTTLAPGANPRWNQHERTRY